MACLNMYKNDQQGLHSTMGPRISFSNDFADTQQAIKHDSSYREAPVSSDFEFLVSGNNMISADKVFSKGRLLPLRENLAQTTLKDELLVEDDYMDVSPQLTKGTNRWRERLGLKKSHILPKKADKNAEVLQRIDETATAFSISDAAYAKFKGGY